MSSPSSSSSSSSFSSIFSLGPSIGHGNYGSVHLATHRPTSHCFAVKLTPSLSPISLPLEHVIYHHLHYPSPLSGIPRVHFSGPLSLPSGCFDALVLDKLGPSLQSILEKRHDQRLKSRRVLKLGIRMLEIIQNVHERGVVHCDLKPDNWLLDDQHGDLCLVDFGLATFWRNEYGKHVNIAYNCQRHAVGMFASRNWHKGIKWSRRDDIEMILYVLAYMRMGHLRWMKESTITMAEMKKQGTGWHIIDNELRLIRQLGYKQTPDYQGIRQRWERQIKREREKERETRRRTKEQTIKQSSKMPSSTKSRRRSTRAIFS